MCIRDSSFTASTVIEPVSSAMSQWRLPTGSCGLNGVSTRSMFFKASFASFKEEMCIRDRAKEFGMGIVALGNNNHWMRGGSYGWQAADQGCIGICWSNTMPNMPAWRCV